jgi:hypothetical protein
MNGKKVRHSKRLAILARPLLRAGVGATLCCAVALMGLPALGQPPPTAAPVALSGTLDVIILEDFDRGRAEGVRVRGP